MNYLTPHDLYIAEQNGISSGLAHQRFYNFKWDRERVITEPPNRSPWDMDKLLERAKRNGVEISRPVLRRRLDRGWRQKDAVTIPIGDRPGSHKKYLEIAKENGIKQNTYFSRVCKQGWSRTRAATQPTRETRDESLRSGVL